MKKIIVIFAFIAVIMMGIAKVQADDFNMHIVYPAKGSTVAATSFKVIGTFDSMPPIKTFKLMVTIDNTTKIYNFTSNSLSFGPIEINLKDFPNIQKGNVYNVTLQAVSENPTVPPFQTDPVKIVWDLKNLKTTIELYIGKATFFVNGEKRYLESSPVVLNNRTFVPIRPIIEALGGSISWDPIESKVTITLGSNTVELWIGKNIARVNGVMKPIDSSDSNVVPKIINGRTMLPLRFIAEALGCSVNWDGVTKKITIIF